MNNHILIEMLSELTALTEEEKIDVQQSFPIKTFPKGTLLLKQGQIARDAYFLIKGCIREFKNDDGIEKTTALFTEHQSVVNFISISNQSPSKINFICMEDCAVTVLNVQKEQALYKKYPRFESLCRNGVEQMMGAKQDQLMDWITLKPEQRYLKLQNERPDIINRVPQYHIASYLGIKPETLSRIRARLAR